MLLPPDPDALPEEQEDPRTELVRRLLEYEKFRNAAQMLYQREMIENASWSNAGAVPMQDGDLEPELNITLYDLMLAFRDVVKRAEQQPSMQMSREEFSIEQMMAFLFEKIASARGPVSLSEVLPELSSRQALITAFLALLELTRLRAICLKQDKAFGDITARANPDYELSKSLSPA
jgi:segregation and condensation protein A